MIAKWLAVGAFGALTLAAPASARSPHSLAPQDAAFNPPPAKLVARAPCRTRQGLSAWEVDGDRQ